MTFDLEKVREANHDYLDLQYQLDSAEAEIERLRADAERSQLIIDSCHEDLNCKSDTIDELESYLEQCKIIIDQQAAQIKELEDAHKRSGAKYAKIINELRSSVYANMPGLKKQWDEILNAPANGKIGPDADAKPHCWQITEERKAVILHCKRMLTFLKEDDAPCYDVEKITKDESVLVAMLEEAQ